MTKRSNAVDDAIKKSWARLAKAAFSRAMFKIELDKPIEAQGYMFRIEDWLDKAGAKATDWYFN